MTSSVPAAPRVQFVSDSLVEQTIAGPEFEFVAHCSNRKD